MVKKKKEKKKNTLKVTPLMRQYFSIKAQHPDAILLFRVGDFYETFGDDAITTSKILGIVLTARNNGGSKIELAGFPYHSLDIYLPRLVRAGYRVAISEQLEKPNKEKKIVKRGVTEVVTPGIATDEQLLEHNKNNYLASVYFGKKDQLGVSFLDLSTGEFLVSQGEKIYIDKLIQGFNPSEIIYSKSQSEGIKKMFSDRYYSFRMDDWVFEYDSSRKRLLDLLGVQNLKGYGIEEHHLGQVSAGAILQYLKQTHNDNTQHIKSLRNIAEEDFVWLDKFTIRNLELLHGQQNKSIPLVEILDQTATPMGARLLRKWILLPLKSIPSINSRQSIVEYFVTNMAQKEQVISWFKQIGDLERLVSKVALNKINPRELKHLQKSLSIIAPLKSFLLKTQNNALFTIADVLNPLPSLVNDIEERIIDEPPVNLNNGGVIASGFHPELDELRDTIRNAQNLVESLQKKEANSTGIDKLKIGFNNVFGYYLEVTNKYKGKGLIPEHWVRKQTLTNSERYITEELKVLESRILGSEDKILELESILYSDLVDLLREYIQPIKVNSYAIAKIDILSSFAGIAIANEYVKPVINESLSIDIKHGRHPVIEKNLPPSESYIPNDLYLDSHTDQILMITGPNMSGKSAVLRQTALICIMAQMGSYVPALSATIGLIDKIFTRVGASDNISGGESTFMVEMNETANIMNNLSNRSLILLDEIGRGTSTYDGISIAWSIVEYLHQNNTPHAKTLFATHYHELNELEQNFDRIKNFHISSKEVDQKIIFLRKLIRGGSEHSFGIHVAKLAGMPNAIVDRANHLLAQLESQRSESYEKIEKNLSIPLAKPTDTRKFEPGVQLNIFEPTNPIANEIKSKIEEIDINNLTPMEALILVNELKSILNSKK